MKIRTLALIGALSTIGIYALYYFLESGVSVQEKFMHNCLKDISAADCEMLWRIHKPETIELFTGED